MADDQNVKIDIILKFLADYGGILGSEEAINKLQNKLDSLHPPKNLGNLQAQIDQMVSKTNIGDLIDKWNHLQKTLSDPVQLGHIDTSQWESTLAKIKKQAQEKTAAMSGIDIVGNIPKLEAEAAALKKIRESLLYANQNAIAAVQKTPVTGERESILKPEDLSKMDVLKDKLTGLNSEAKDFNTIWRKGRESMSDSEEAAFNAKYLANIKERIQGVTAFNKLNDASGNKEKPRSLNPAFEQQADVMQRQLVLDERIALAEKYRNTGAEAVAKISDADLVAETNIAAMRQKTRDNDEKIKIEREKINNLESEGLTRLKDEAALQENILAIIKQQSGLYNKIGSQGQGSLAGGKLEETNPDIKRYQMVSQDGLEQTAELKAQQEEVVNGLNKRIAVEEKIQAINLKVAELQKEQILNENALAESKKEEAGLKDATPEKIAKLKEQLQISNALVKNQAYIDRAPGAREIARTGIAPATAAVDSDVMKGYKAQTAEVQEGITAQKTLAATHVQTGTTISGTLSKVEGAFRKVRYAIFDIRAALMGFGGIYLFVNQIKEAAEFEWNMANIKNALMDFSDITGNTTTEVEKTVRQVGLLYFGAKASSEAMMGIARAGLTGSEALTLLGTTAKFAAANAGSIDDSSKLLVMTMKDYGITAEETATKADIFTYAIMRSQMDMDKMVQSMKYAGPTAKVFGNSIEDTVSVLSSLVDLGYQGGTAGQYFRFALVSMNKELIKSPDALKKIGLSMKDVDPTAHSLADTLTMLSKTAFSMPDATKMFGSRAAPAMMNLIQSIREGTISLVQFKKELASAQEGNVTERAFQQMMNTAKGATGMMSAAFSELDIEVFKQLKQPIIDVATSLRQAALDAAAWAASSEGMAKLKGWAYDARDLAYGLGTMVVALEKSAAVQTVLMGLGLVIKGLGSESAIASVGFQLFLSILTGIFVNLKIINPLLNAMKVMFPALGLAISGFFSGGIIAGIKGLGAALATQAGAVIALIAAFGMLITYRSEIGTFFSELSDHLDTYRSEIAKGISEKGFFGGIQSGISNAYDINAAKDKAKPAVLSDEEQKKKDAEVTKMVSDANDELSTSFVKLVKPIDDYIERLDQLISKHSLNRGEMKKTDEETDRLEQRVSALDNAYANASSETEKFIIKNALMATNLSAIKSAFFNIEAALLGIPAGTQKAIDQVNRLMDQGLPSSAQSLMDMAINGKEGAVIARTNDLIAQVRHATAAGASSGQTQSMLRLGMQQSSEWAVKTIEDARKASEKSLASVKGYLQEAYALQKQYRDKINAADLSMASEKFSEEQRQFQSTLETQYNTEGGKYNAIMSKANDAYIAAKNSAEDEKRLRKEGFDLLTQQKNLQDDITKSSGDDNETLKSNLKLLNDKIEANQKALTAAKQTRTENEAAGASLANQAKNIKIPAEEGGTAFNANEMARASDYILHNMSLLKTDMLAFNKGFDQKEKGFVDTKTHEFETIEKNLEAQLVSLENVFIQFTNTMKEMLKNSLGDSQTKALKEQFDKNFKGMEQTTDGVPNGIKIVTATEEQIRTAWKDATKDEQNKIINAMKEYKGGALWDSVAQSFTGNADDFKKALEIVNEKTYALTPEIDKSKTAAQLQAEALKAQAEADKQAAEYAEFSKAYKENISKILTESKVPAPTISSEQTKDYEEYQKMRDAEDAARKDTNKVSDAWDGVTEAINGTQKATDGYSESTQATVQKTIIQLEALKAAYSGVKKSIEDMGSVTSETGVSSDNSSDTGVSGMASGGQVGTGYGGGDRIPIMGEAGEVMIRKEAVKKYGLATMLMINRGQIKDTGSLAMLMADIEKQRGRTNFSTGGPVVGTGKKDEVNLVFKIGDNAPIMMHGELSAAKQIAEQFRHEGMCTIS